MLFFNTLKDICKSRPKGKPIKGIAMASSLGPTFINIFIVFRSDSLILSQNFINALLIIPFYFLMTLHILDIF